MADDRTLELLVMASNKELKLSLPSHMFFDGGLGFLQSHNLTKPLLALFILIGFALFAEKRVHSKMWTLISLGLVSGLSILLSLHGVRGQDEFFIGLKHAYAMVHAHHYSYVVDGLQEGVGDFIPVFLTGILGLLGLPLAESDISIGLIGNIWLIFIGWSLFQHLFHDRKSALIFAAFLGVFPCVSLTGAVGFFAALYTAAVLQALYLTLVSDSKNAQRIGFILLSILTLFRLEGVLIAFLVWAYKAVQGISGFRGFSYWRKNLTQGLLLITPFLIACASRLYWFGHPFPAPVAMKNAGWDPAYIKVGWRYFISAIQYHYAYVPIAIGIPLMIHLGRSNIKARKLTLIWLILLVTSIPYITGGGDYFPIYWSRYLVPFILFSYMAFWIGLFFLLERSKTKSWAMTAFSLCFFCLPYLISSLPFLSEGGPQNGGRNAFAWDLEIIKTHYLGWDRADLLAPFGVFLKDTTPESTKIASPEEATLMYFAERDAIDLTGFALPDVSYSPKNPMTPGDLLHRKRNPSVIKKYRPGIIALCEMADQPFPHLKFGDDRSTLDQAEKWFRKTGFSGSLINIAYYRAGSSKYLEGLGYQYLVVMAPNALFYYLVDKKILADHLNKLRALDYREVGKRTLKFHYDPEIVKKFTSGEELL